ncbi:cytochrome d ubiquinol oxidase subunit II [Stratiformator vulcanicus]|uniref:Cytochrome bd-I ubiquinol oxidase subunit 2 n=1 Tax=Stratiformator vulcanicus TaxID=2527980 RepID=A0A517R3R8_9PLAN|nr:cytochrome d ubiquinol oxidase subunit II [Stratiformator vulcanicus]QDT38490.1 Cytochrome bd-I ubiquinol oxidase subunit 2 [Stratiformator vulcanicus]
MDWQTLWFWLLGVLLAGYAILDGFDLGVAMLHFVGRDDKERRLILNSVGPLWDGNEVWLVTFGGALFAAFPEAYATAFSGFYLAFMLLLYCLIFRAISIEFRGKVKSANWRRIWDVGFCVSSSLAALLFGVAIGAAMTGVPLSQRGVFVGNFFHQISPYALTVGAMTMALLAMHGANYLYLKTEGELQARFKPWRWRTFFVFLALFLVVSVWTLATIDRATQNLKEYPWGWVVVVLNVLAIFNLPRGLYHKKPITAFVSSSCMIAAFVFLFGFTLWPNLVTSNPNPEHSLTIYNSSSSIGTLKLMTLVAVIGAPFILSYTAIMYWTFRGKVELDEHSY